MKCKKYYLTCLLVLGVCLSAMAKPAAQDQYAIKIDAPQLGLQKIFLGHYYMGKLYVQDSLQLNKKGKGEFTADKKLQQGMYVLYRPSGQYADLLIGDDQSFTLKVDTTDMRKNLQVHGSNQTSDFQQYALYLTQKQEDVTGLSERYKNASEAEQAAIKDSMAWLSDEVKHRQDSLIAVYPDGMMSVFLKGLRTPELPEWTDSLSCNNVDSCKMMHRYLFYKQHYLDNINLSDIRSFRTSFINTTMDTYLNKVLVQINDSIIPSALEMVERSRGNDTTFQTVANYVLNYSVKSKIMGMDNLMVEMGKRYYLSGLATWADSTLKANLTSEINKIERSLIGMQAHNIPLADKEGKYRYLYDMGGEQLTVLYFYEPSCGHCRKTTPILAEFAKKYKDDPRIKIVAVYMLEDENEWQTFVEKNDMSALVNVWDPKRYSNYWYWYDTSTTPMMYVMDQEHRLFAKKIDVETLEKIAQYELK